MQWSKKSAVAGCTRVSIGKKVFFFLLLADSQESSFLFLLLDGYRLSKSASTYDKSIKTLSTDIKLDWISMRLKDLFQISLVRKSRKKGNATLLHHRSDNPKTSFTFCWSSKLMKRKSVFLYQSDFRLPKYRFLFPLKKCFCFNLRQKRCCEASRFIVESSLSFSKLGLSENIFCSF